ncbi:hypothetical protein [Streptomyces asiaticus]|uniref:hypothetical protein n=1 Tax=Streptomyces asiaticus TaxID=114695 RepID=UPI001BAE138E|nr:hypothetical protein [Streptomyces asiaticus]
MNNNDAERDHPRQSGRVPTEQSEIESLLRECVAELGNRTTGITKLAELIAEQGRRIGALEVKVAQLTGDRTTEQ